MDFNKSKIHISIKNTEYSFNYLYNKVTTFQELLEYIAFYLPSLNICGCYNFQAAEHKNNFDDQCILITKNCKIADYSNYLKKLRLKNNNNNCLHSDKNKNYLLYSKQEIISIYEKEKAALNERIYELENTLKLPLPNNKKPFNFYDVIVHIDSIKDINKGWKIEMNEDGKKNYNNFKNEKNLKIGVIGNANKGKSFLLSKISKMELPSGMSIKTEGLSIKYPELGKYKDRKIVLLDSAGLETPVLD